MKKKKFIPQDWLQPAGQDKNPDTVNIPDNRSRNEIVQNDIETIVRRIEAARLDIAPDYAGWRDLGFALSDELGESGRSYFHRLSRFYPHYNKNETDKQFSKCLKSNGHSVTIKTLYHFAKNAGVKLTVSSPSKNTEPDRNDIPTAITVPRSDPEDIPLKELPVFPDEIYAGLPSLLRLATQKATSSDDRDLLLLGSIVVLSALLPNVSGIYAEREVYPNLFLFITAQASAGKGQLSLCRKLVEPIHQALREQSKKEHEIYQRLLSEYAATKGKTNVERPCEPPLRMLIIPANSSATGLFQVLNENKGIGLIFETEGDTLAQTFKSEYGNYSDGFRKAFHHETISYNRRKDREYVELTEPRLSALLSGTPKQVMSLVTSTENGLFSRFIFYCMNIRPVWKNVFEGEPGQTLDHYFEQLGLQFYEFYKYLQRQPEALRFRLTMQQQETFNAYFSQAQDQYLYLCGPDYLATVRRLGLITFRIAMILTSLRIMDKLREPAQNGLYSEDSRQSRFPDKTYTGTIDTPLTCSDTDFQTALTIVKTLMHHASQVYQHLPVEAIVKTQPSQRQLFFDALPETFCRQDYLNIARQSGIPAKTAEKYITRFLENKLIIRFMRNEYKKN